ncbi:hypothetical protein BJV77DRAFT_1069628 [Russula vinacea]|nr:hypothetical protein BJV77DRAFT_1069628 [Russula vinacea]
MNCLATFNLDRLATLTTDNFTQVTAPASLNVPVRTKAEDLEFLGQLRDKLQNKPFTVTIYDVNDSIGKTWLHGKLGDPLDIEVVYLFQFGVGPFALKVTSVTEFSDSKRLEEIGT